MSDPVPQAAARSWPELLSALLRGEHLTGADTAWAMREIMTGEATPAQLAGFAISLRAKGETAEEINGLAATMVELANQVPHVGDALDIVGSGGDRAHTVNVSTMAAIVAAAAGVRVAKHGNRAASSACGAADLLEELGVAIDLDGDGVAACVAQVGIGFCFAPVFHPAFRFTAAPRRELGVPTVFNFLGPLTNPARPTSNAVGVADARMAPAVAAALAQRGNRALVFRGDDGLDELTTTTTSQVWVVRDGVVRTAVLDPGDLGISRAAPAELKGADAVYNAKVARAVFTGERGAVRDTVLLNAAAGVVASEGPTAESLVDQLRAAITRCAQAIDEGAANAKLDDWVDASQSARRPLDGD